jgi:hypothetical protein
MKVTPVDQERQKWGNALAERLAELLPARPYLLIVDAPLLARPGEPTDGPDLFFNSMTRERAIALLEESLLNMRAVNVEDGKPVCVEFPES